MSEQNTPATPEPVELELQDLEEQTAPGFWEGVSIGITIVSTIVTAT